MLVKKLSKHGNSLALIIDKPILELLGIDENTNLEIKTDGERLVVMPEASESSRQLAFEGLLAETNERYGGMLSRLAK